MHETGWTGQTGRYWETSAWHKSEGMYPSVPPGIHGCISDEPLINDVVDVPREFVSVLMA